MAQLIGRNIEKALKSRLQRRAQRNWASVEDEARDILRRTSGEEATSTGGLGAELADLFARVGLGVDIPELRGHTVKPFD